MKRGLLIILVLFVNNIHSQNNVEDILKGYGNTLRSDTDYRVNIVYKIYKGHASTKVSETKKGVFCKGVKKSYTKIDEVEILNTPKVHIKVNHSERAILVAEGLKTPDNLNINLTDLHKYLKSRVLSEDSVSWEIEFSPKGALTQVPFDKLIVRLSKKSYRLKSQIFYYYTKFNFSKEIKKQDVEKVKFEVVFSNYQKMSTAYISKIFNEKNYVNIKHKKITVSSKLTGYDIVNLKK